MPESSPLMIGLQFAISAGLIIVAGIFIARASDAIADLTKLGRLLVGSVFLAGATSLPEIAVDLNAVRAGMPDLAVGDLMGSSLSNLLILAVADLVHKNSKKIFSRASAAHALSGTMSINLAAVAAFMIYLGPHLPGFESLPVGPGPIVIAVIYVLGTRLIYHDQRVFMAEKNPVNLNKQVRRRELIRSIGIFLMCTATILLASPLLAQSAGEIADLTGLGKTFVGSTLVAFCTSLPELVSTFTALKMGAFDLAVGNIFGSNSFNMLILLPLDLAYDGPLLASISPFHILTAIATILATSVAIMGQLYQVEKRKKLIEPDALAIIVIVFAALWSLYHVGARS